MFSFFSRKPRYLFARLFDIDRVEYRLPLDILLSADEIARSELLLFEEDKHRYIVAHRLLRLTLSRYFSLPPAEINITYDRRGEPRLANGLGRRHFISLAYAANCVLVSVSDVRVGADLRRVYEAEPALLLPKNLVTSAEKSIGGDIRDYELRMVFFYNIWAMKQAIIKVLYDDESGAPPLQLIDVTSFLHAPYQTPVFDPAQHWYVTRLPVGQNYVAACALRTKRREVQLDFEYDNAV